MTITATAPEVIAALREDLFGDILETSGERRSDTEQDEAAFGAEAEPPFGAEAEPPF